MMATYDLMFVLSAVLFTLLITGSFIAQKHGKPKLLKGLCSLICLYRGGKGSIVGTA